MALRAAVVILAGGVGARMHQGRNKVYVTVGGRSILEYSLATAVADPQVTDVVLVVRPDDTDHVRSVLDAVGVGGDGPNLHLVDGGSTRHRSERAGVAALGPAITDGAVDVVAVHDGARPFLTPGLLARVLAEAADTGGAIAALSVTDTLYSADEHALVEAGSLAWAQTPQAFAAPVLLAAHDAAAEDGFEGLDTAEVVSRFTDQPITMVPGDPDNLKVTFSGDLSTAEAVAARWPVHADRA
jgi:2-C-methyl-D-erythritol 4-phosphate cytidylyltransferase